ncbi:MAG: histidine phosphatase family protein [Blautia sp.]|nr:histidine phosphatase family protein [Blautia sp.]
MTTVYFVRHAESDYANHNELSRELTEKGLEDSRLVTNFLSDRKIDMVFSSPYKRALDTIRNFADLAGLEIHIENDFRERKAGSGWMEDYTSFCRAQWMDFHYKLPDGESLQEVQTRNITALNRLLDEYGNRTIVIGTHGTALSTIINFYDRQFGWSDFEKIRGLMPWVVKITFDRDVCVEI